MNYQAFICVDFCRMDDTISLKQQNDYFSPVREIPAISFSLVAIIYHLASLMSKKWEFINIMGILLVNPDTTGQNFN